MTCVPELLGFLELLRTSSAAVFVAGQYLVWSGLRGLQKGVNWTEVITLREAGS